MAGRHRQPVRYGDGERIYLEAFGKDNAAAFEALLGAQGGASQ
jgi:hypothetical protein